MRNNNLTYKFGIFILLLGFELSAQTTEMIKNDNQIDRDFIPTTEIQTSIDEQILIGNEVNLFLEKSSDSLYAIYVINKTSDSISISTQDWNLYLIQEAKDQSGNWKPIEYWNYSSCGNSYLYEKIKPNGILKTKSLAYFGNFKTEIRFKLLNKNRTYYSNPISGFVNVSQFSIPKKITEEGIFKRIDIVGGSELLKKVITLEPDGMKEYGEKQEVYLMKMAELRKKNKN